MDGMNSINNSIADYVNVMSEDTADVLRSIDLTLRSIAKADGIIISQSSLQDMANEFQHTTPAQRNRYNKLNRNQQDSNQQSSSRFTGRPDRNASGRGSTSDRLFDANEVRRRGTKSARQFIDDLTDELEGTFVEAIMGSRHPFQDAMAKSIREFADGLGVDVDNLGKEVGKRIGQQVAYSFQNNALGRRLQQEWQGLANNMSNMGQGMLNRFGQALNINPNSFSKSAGAGGATSTSGGGFGDFVNQSMSDVASAMGNGTSEAASQFNSATSAVTSELSKVGSAAKEAANSAEGLATSTSLAQLGTTALSTEVGSAAAGLESAGMAAMNLSSTFPIVTQGLLSLGSLLLDQFLSAFDPLIEGVKGMFSALKKVANRTESQATKNLELAEARIKADMTSLAKIPFQILEDAANKVMDTWDNVLQTITATQETDKAGLQELWSSYAQRLQAEGLDSVISSADMMENLKRVLESGLSGEAAEEFAYLATVLNNALPTQDFFQYADSYASLIANATKGGEGTEGAINSANRALENFASSLIYANKYISGGLSSSLKNGAQLFEDAAKIAITSRTGSVDEISAVLTSVSAMVGSVAPDLASGVVDAVVKAAVGGNSNEITALRAMTSVGASNTAFLKALAENPQELFAELFTNLAKLQNMSADNYMEVAEALSSVFGLSMDAFARVDFDQLAKSISKMNLYSGQIYDRIEDLQSGETTLSASQLRMQEINKYMIDEGLSYVLDSELGRAVQEHMWEEQLMREVEENTFAVDLQGAALELLQAIANTVKRLNPLHGMQQIGDTILSSIESSTMSQDIHNVLEAQKVGEGNAKELFNLTTQNVDLGLIATLPELVGLQSLTKQARQSNRILNDAIQSAGYAITGAGAGALPFTFGQDIIDSIQEQADENLNSAVLANQNASDLAASAAGYGGVSNGSGSASGENLGTLKASTTEKLLKMKRGNYFNWSTVSKESGLAGSGDWRTGATYSSIWHSQTAVEASNKDTVQKFIDSMKDYTAQMASSASSEGKLNQAIQSAREGSDYKYLTEEALEDLVHNTEVVERSFEDWVDSAYSDYGIANLGQTLSEYGLTLTDIQGKFEAYQTKAEEKNEHARQMHEVQFWENVEEYNNNYFPNHFENEFLRVDWMENWETNYLTPIRDDLHQFLEDWEDYYIHHTAYTQATADAYEEAIKLADLEKDETGDAVLALSKALVENSNWLQENQEVLKDPVVHANVLLSQILLVTESIMQQTNSVATTSSIPTTLLGLSTGGIAGMGNNTYS